MKKLVVVGGGFAGARIAQKLQSQFAVTLIDSKSYFEFTPGVLRTIVEPNHIKKLQRKHKKYLPQSTVIRGKATKFTRSHVFLGKKKIPYDYLVIATGSRYALPIKDEAIISQRAKLLRANHKQLVQAKNVLIIGGGFVGVELAAEICDVFSEKNIIVVEGSSRLLARSTKRASNYAEQFLKKRGVTIIFNQHVNSGKKGVFVTSNGDKIRSDITFLCVGIKPNSQCVDDEICNQRQQVEINDFLQLKGWRNVFAAGDIVALDEEKLAQTAERHADAVIENIIRLDAGAPLVRYQPKKRPMLVSLGKNRGILVYKNWTWTGWLPALLKRHVEFMTMLRFSRGN